jgi:hypothetical protein
MNLRRIVFVLFLLTVFCPEGLYAQKYNAIDKVVLTYPKHFNSTEDLAQRIQKDFRSDYDKARAIYSWIALNIKYDYQAYLKPPEVVSFSYRTEAEKQNQIALIKEKTWQKAFNSDKAVCEGFTLLYQRLAALVGLKSQVIRGDSKRALSDIGREKSYSNHAWNIVEVDGKWLLLDVTWGQGYYDTNRKTMVNHFTSVYFDTDPKYFFAKHFPDSGTYLNRKLIKDDFLNGPLIFDQTIAGDYEIMKPKSGVIQAQVGDRLFFKIKNISKSDRLYYVNKKHQGVKIDKAREVNGALEFELTYDRNMGSFITFFLNQNSIVAFKIVSK